jgi:hypothetical protein
MHSPFSRLQLDVLELPSSPYLHLRQQLKVIYYVLSKTKFLGTFYRQFGIHSESLIESTSSYTSLQ